MAIAPVSFTEHITKISTLQADLGIKEIKIKALEEHVKLLEEHVGVLEEALKQPRSENREVEDNHGVDSDRGVEGVSDLRETIAYLQDCIKRQAETLRKQVDTIFDSQDKIKTLEEEIQKKREQIKNQADTIQRLRKDEKTNLNQISDLESVVQVWKDRYTDLVVKHKEKETELFKKIAELEANLHLQQEREKMHIDEVQTKLRSAEDKNRFLLDENQILRIKVAQKPNPRDGDWGNF